MPLRGTKLYTAPPNTGELAAAWETWLQKACDNIEEDLLRHRLTNWREEDDHQSGFPLLDHLASTDIASGKHEIEMLVETIYFAMKRTAPEVKK